MLTWAEAMSQAYSLQDERIQEVPKAPSHSEPGALNKSWGFAARWLCVCVCVFDVDGMGLQG